jgi:hypothetical protein
LEFSTDWQKTRFKGRGERCDLLGGGNWLVVEALLHPTAFFFLVERALVLLGAPQSKHKGKLTAMKRVQHTLSLRPKTMFTMGSESMQQEATWRPGLMG